uniref:Uncharacterized protein n=1 Tax=Glossina pallidipes TaxID=7398 RepID=A0A1A9Z5P9_GLOPL
MAVGTLEREKAPVSQVLQRTDDVSLMYDKRTTSLKTLALKPPRPVQRVTLGPAGLLQRYYLRFCNSGSFAKELQKALDCMLIVLKCVNNSKQQVTGIIIDLAKEVVT